MASQIQGQSQIQNQSQSQSQTQGQTQGQSPLIVDNDLILMYKTKLIEKLVELFNDSDSNINESQFDTISEIISKEFHITIQNIMSEFSEQHIQEKTQNTCNGVTNAKNRCKITSNFLNIHGFCNNHANQDPDYNSIPQKHKTTNGLDSSNSNSNSNSNNNSNNIVNTNSNTIITEKIKNQCNGITSSRVQCKKQCKEPNSFCHLHLKK